MAMRLFLCGILAISFFGCSSFLGDGGELIPYEVLTPDDVRGYWSEDFLNVYGRETVISTQDGLDAFWEIKYRDHVDPVTGERRDIPEKPVIDFDQETLVAVHFNAPTGGYGLHMDRARHHHSSIIVDVIKTTPGPTCVVTQAIVPHYLLVRIDAAGKPVDIKWSKNTRDC